MKTIVVTGATKGIGRAICKKFAIDGFALAICSRNNQELKEFSKELIKLGASNVFYEQCDVSNKGDLHLFADHLLEEFGTIDILVNNAGVFIPGRIIEEEDGMLEKMVETNLYSAYYLTRFLISAIKQSEKPHIFNMCSTASTMAYANGGSYSISKFAMLGMNKVLRAELMDTNVKVTALLPGPTYTNSWAGVEIPKERFMQSEEIADLLYSAYMLTGNAVVEEILIRPQEGDL